MLSTAPPAAATSCAPVTERQELRHADVVFEGVVLSGPRGGNVQPLRRHFEGDGRLVSPARFQVLRYIKGSGPKVVDVGTGNRQVMPGDTPVAFGEVVGDFDPAPGQVWRIYGQTPRRAGDSADRGVREPGPCDGSELKRTGAGLNAQSASKVEEPDPSGERIWNAKLFKGPGPLRCVRFGRSGYAPVAECDRLRGSGELSVGVASAGNRETASTAVVASGPRLESIAVEGADGVETARARRSGRIALLVLDGYVDRGELRIEASFRDGSVRVLDYAARRAVADDPEDEPGWAATAEPTYPKRGGGAKCTRFEQVIPRSGSSKGYRGEYSGECGKIERDSFFFAVRRVLEYDFEANESRPRRTVVFGALAPEVVDVTIDGPDGRRRPAIAERGRAFISVYSPSVTYRDLTLTFRLSDGSSETFSGRRQAHVVHLGEPALSP